MEFLDILREAEQKWQKKWQDDQLFVAQYDPSKPKWFITVPYPYASGPQHIGHGRTYTMGDIFARIKRQQGFNVLWPMAFHITGTPILAIAQKIKDNDPNTKALFREYIGLYESNETQIEKIIQSFEDPKCIAMFFAGKLINDFLQMGFSIDTTRQFSTGDAEYMKFIEWQYSLLSEKGLITRDTYPILWCINCNNAVGEDDIQSGDEQKVEVVEFVGIKFRIINEGSYYNMFLTAATFRPETIFGVTNLWINPTASYIQIHIDQEQWIVAKPALEKLIRQNHILEIQKEVDIMELLSLEVEAPITRRKIPIYPAVFIDPNNSTGIVYSVPAHAPYDFIALMDLKKNDSEIQKWQINKEKLAKIQPISLITSKNYGEFPAQDICVTMQIKSQLDIEKLEEATQILYKTEFYTGILNDTTAQFAFLPVEKAKNEVKSNLMKNKTAVVLYEVSRKAKCRCGGDVIVAIIPDQYFLNYGDPAWKQIAFEALNTMKIFPEKYRQTFETIFNWLDKRPCVRRRGLGTEFPLTKGQGWIIESLSDSVIYMAYYTIVKIIRENHIQPSQLTPALFDFIFLNKGSCENVNQNTKIPQKVIRQLKQEFEYWYPNDFRHTAIAHISNHLSFAIFHHAVIFPKKYWIQAISLNNLLIREGQKMGKSKGNVIPIAMISKQYSVDLARLHLAGNTASDSVIDWKEKEVLNSLQKIKKFWDFAISIKEFISHEIDIRNEFKVKKETLSFISQAILASIQFNLKRAIDLMENYDVRGYISSAFFENLQILDNYDRMTSFLSKSERNETMSDALIKINQYISPVIPHICEEINSLWGFSGYISLQTIPQVILTETDWIFKSQAQYIEELIEDLTKIIQMIRITPSRIHIYITAAWKIELYQKIKDLYPDKKMEKKSIMTYAKQNPNFQPFLADIFKELEILERDPGLYKRDYLSTNQQFAALSGYQQMLSHIFSNAEICIVFADNKGGYDPQQKAKKATPMKPAIFIE